MKPSLSIACIGHIICVVTDCMLAYTPDGRFDFKKDTADHERMKKLTGQNIDRSAFFVAKYR